ncbi:MAG TPA: glycosyl hydrolase family 65 protein [Acidimicrobiia bacterium]
MTSSNRDAEITLDGHVQTGMASTVDEERPIDPWVLEYWSYEPAEELLREALCTVGNGRFATRGAAPEHSRVEGVHYPGTYAAGIYNRLATEKAGREIENESLVNLPNWLAVTFRVEDGPWFSIDDVDIKFFRQALELDRGILIREVSFTDGEGRETTLTQRRLVHMTRPSVAALETNLRAENWEGQVTVRSSIDGGVQNQNVRRYRDLPGDHLEVVDRGMDQERLTLLARTSQSNIDVVIGVRHRLWLGDELVTPQSELSADRKRVTEDLSLNMAPGAEVRFEKTVSLKTGRDTAISEPLVDADEELSRLPDFASLEAEQARAWWSVWRRFELDVAAEPRVRLITNLHLFHLLQVASRNLYDLDAGVPARGLHGEAYRGHVFWDELFIFPLLHVRSPEVAQSLLRYRYRRLPAARLAARDAGYEGAMFPWQSGSDGREETQEVHLNPKSGRWNPDRSHRQRHINIAIAYNIVQYLRFTGDIDFLAEFGAEMLIEIARFWASIAEYDRMSDRYQIVGVMGPDEFHDVDPGWDGPALRNNAYTNVMVAWLLAGIPDTLEPLPSHQRAELFARLEFKETELADWDEISRKLVVPQHGDGIISQFQGYEALEELDWDSYRSEYDNIERLDRILEAEDDSVSRYKASKQADVLMLFYLLSFEELVDVFDRLGVRFDEDDLAANIAYYIERTSHGSTLSRVVHSWVLARSDRELSYALFNEALESDVSDIQGGTTQEGIHLGAMAGTVDLLQRGYTGMEVDSAGVLHFKPRLPNEVESLSLCVYFRRRWLDITIADDSMAIRSEITTQPPVEISYRGDRATLASGETKRFRS